jgi:hypothetical protein
MTDRLKGDRGCTIRSVMLGSGSLSRVCATRVIEAQEMGEARTTQVGIDEKHRASVAWARAPARLMAVSVLQVIMAGSTRR